MTWLIGMLVLFAAGMAWWIAGVVKKGDSAAPVELARPSLEPIEGPGQPANLRTRKKTAEQFAAEVQTRADLNRLWKKLEREEAKIGSFVTGEANDRQVERVELLQEAIGIVERTHEWANYGEGYKPELDPPKRRTSKNKSAP